VQSKHNNLRTGGPPRSKPLPNYQRVSIKYSMHGVIRGVINYCAWGYNTGKISVAYVKNLN